MTRTFKQLELMDRLLIGHMMDLGYRKKAVKPPFLVQRMSRGNRDLADKLDVHIASLFIVNWSETMMSNGLSYWTCREN